MGARLPDFGAELRRPFSVATECWACVELFGPGHGERGCDAWPAGKPFRCGDFYPLPPVGVNGATGQVFPPSRMHGRKQPRETGRRSRRATAPEPIERAETLDTPAPAKPPRASADGANGRTASPAASYGPDGERLCECGAALKKRQRCCDDCRQKRRKEAVQRWLDRKHPAAAVDAASGRPVFDARGHTAAAGIPSDN